MRFFGVDGEMSGSELAEGHRLIQIGVAVDTDASGAPLEQPDLFCSLIGWSSLKWDEQAAKVHNIPIEDVWEAPRASQVDEALCDWLTDRGANPKKRRNQVMVGFNVGVFDGPFIQQALPMTFKYFTRRYADLNPLCFAMGTSLGISGGQGSYAGWKKSMKRAGRATVQQVGRTEAEHDAGTDALMALGAWRYIEDTLKSLDADATRARKRDREIRKSQTQASQGLVLEETWEAR